MKRLIQIQLGASRDCLHQARAAAATHGCTGIELSCASRDLSDEINSQSVSRFLEQTEQAGLPRCEALSLAPTSSGHLASSELEQVIETAAFLGAKRLSISPATVGDSDRNHVSYQDALNRTFDGLKLVARRLERCGMTLALRAAQHGFLMSPPELRELICGLNCPAIGADINCTSRDDRASLDDWLATLGNMTCAIGVTLQGGADLQALESAFSRTSPAAHQSAHLVLRPGPSAGQSR